MSGCIKGMEKEEIFMELTKDDMGKCSGCSNLEYKNGMMTCSCLIESNGGTSNEI